MPAMRPHGVWVEAGEPRRLAEWWHVVGSIGRSKLDTPADEGYPGGGEAVASAVKSLLSMFFR